MNKIRPMVLFFKEMSIKELKEWIMWAENEIFEYEEFINKLKKESRGRRK